MLAGARCYKQHMVGGMWNAARCAACALLVAIASCGDDGGGGAAGAPAPPGKLGETCTPGCETGLVCASGGVLDGLCTVGCTTQQSCLLLAPGAAARCVGETNARCALGCTDNGDCPAGTQCGQVAGTMACVVAQ